MGEYAEAHAWLDQADSYNIRRESEENITAQLIRSMTLVDEGRFEENVTHCLGLEALFREFGTPVLNGCLAGNLGVSLKDLGRHDEALSYLNLARAYHERARHQIYLGTIENNLAMLYKDVGQFELAHLSVDSAIAIYRKLRDKARRGSSLDTKAQIYLADHKLDLAEKTADRSINALRDTENLAYLVDSLVTKARILVEKDNFADAVLALTQAVDIARRQSGESRARQLIIEFERAVDERRKALAAAPRSPVNAQLEILVPPGPAGEDLGVVLLEDARELLGNDGLIPAHLVGVEDEHAFVDVRWHGWFFHERSARLLARGHVEKVHTLVDPLADPQGDGLDRPGDGVVDQGAL